jgi:hypothetical protein
VEIKIVRSENPKNADPTRGDQYDTSGIADQPIQNMAIGTAGAPHIAHHSIASGSKALVTLPPRNSDLSPRNAKGQVIEA